MSETKLEQKVQRFALKLKPTSETEPGAFWRSGTETDPCYSQ